MALPTISVLVARVAVHAVVDITVHVGVIEAGCVVAAMAARALEHRVIGRIGMAVGAHALGVAVVDREEGVITGRQCRPRPGSRGMAGGAGGRPAGGGVVRIGGAGVVLGVAG